MRNLEQLYPSNLQSIINSDISGRLQCANEKKLLNDTYQMLYD